MGPTTVAEATGPREKRSTSSTRICSATPKMPSKTSVTSSATVPSVRCRTSSGLTARTTSATCSACGSSSHPRVDLDQPIQGGVDLLVHAGARVVGRVGADGIDQRALAPAGADLEVGVLERQPEQDPEVGLEPD